jgi:hypothetical protein
MSGNKDAQLRLSALVYLPSVSHPEDENEQLAVMDFVDDAVVTCANAPLSCAADQPGGGRWSRILGQQFDRGLESAPYLGVELAELTCRCR